MCAHVCRDQKSTSVAISQVPFPLFETGSLQWPGACQIGRAGWQVSPKGPLGFPSPVLGLQEDITHHTQPFDMGGFWAVNVGPPALLASSLSAEPSPQLYTMLTYSCFL